MRRHPPGRHFLADTWADQCSRPRAARDRRATIDHRGPDFQRWPSRCWTGSSPSFKTAGPIIVYPASGTGAWEAALVNTLSPGDRVLMYETGHFATLWHDLAQRLASCPS